MLRIDSHQHFWKFNKVRDSWITEDMEVLRDDFLPKHLEPILEHFEFDGCVVVQSDQSPAENKFQLQNAKTNPFIKGVVGWVDLQADDIESQLEELSVHERLKGFRHILQGEEDRALMLKPAFVNGISKLRDFGYTYDLLIFPDQMKYAAELVAKFPNQLFVLDHIAKPEIKNKKIADWQKDIEMLAGFENVYCKVSGIVTEADWNYWKAEDFTPYLDVVFNAFRAERVMYGSDWPVSLLAAIYGQLIDIMEGYVSKKLSLHQQELFWGGNATKFYNLK
ncbi:amidohydrolase family protein [Pedobacter frigoris]|uniref:Amidohydrolase n=1 Tax=Pedobacter frigoris TaxID=2571272 RepID=A0A4U1CE15_9SPHI|nr:amidohydrolase family protein [Pedobacter frigoris]TKC05234.1 amidohydrolase [Pedobacter frigoris]